MALLILFQIVFVFPCSLAVSSFTDQNIELATLGSLPAVLIGPVENSVFQKWQKNFCYCFNFGIFANLVLIIVSIWWTSLNKSPASVEVASTIFWSVISLFCFSSFPILICFCFGSKRHQLMKFKSSPRKLKTQNGRIVPGRSWMVFRSENPSLKRPSTCLGSQVHKASTRGSEWVPAMYCGRLYPPSLLASINKPNANK